MYMKEDFGGGVCVVVGVVIREVEGWSIELVIYFSFVF